MGHFSAPKVLIEREEIAGFVRNTRSCSYVVIAGVVQNV